MDDFARILAALDEADGDRGASNEYLEHLKHAAVNFVSSDVVLEAVRMPLRSLGRELPQIFRESSTA